MAYKTWLNCVNEVQRRLRESTTANVSTNSYSTLLGIYVNEAKREVEDAWNWNVLRDTITATTSAGVTAYTLTGSRNRYRILGVFNNTEDYELRQVSSDRQTKNLLSNPQQGKPLYFTINGEDASGDGVADLFPIPDAVYAVNFNLVIPQADCDADADEIWVPSEPVILGAYAKALGERGEDTGDGYMRAMQAYQMAMANAIAQDEGRTPFETDFYAV